MLAVALRTDLDPFSVFVDLVENPEDEEEIASVQRRLDREDPETAEAFRRGHHLYIEDAYNRYCLLLWGPS